MVNARRLLPKSPLLVQLTKMTKEKQVSNQQYEEVRRERYNVVLIIRLVRVWIGDLDARVSA